MQFAYVDGKKYGIARGSDGEYLIRRIGRRGPVGDFLTPSGRAYKRVIQVADRWRSPA